MLSYNGPSTLLASGEGLLVANDISQERVKALIYNLELAGVRNVIVTNESPERLAKKFNGYFDKILVDAPCSGFGIIGKKPDIKYHRKAEDIYELSSLSLKILENSAKYVKKGGMLVFSTCTILKEENENNGND